jgi:hypothetical protein
MDSNPVHRDCSGSGQTERNTAEWTAAQQLVSAKNTTTRDACRDPTSIVRGQTVVIRNGADAINVSRFMRRGCPDNGDIRPSRAILGVRKAKQRRRLRERRMERRRPTDRRVRNCPLASWPSGIGLGSYGGAILCGKRGPEPGPIVHRVTRGVPAVYR